ncbi:STAS domain-containing protein [Butyrivibrio sp. YAB3001]|uniref:STAS domain-containing protein n=1 Tax=Butyrivibrio sp. YAB3001 TaxID=1520812 RepID=UPI0008F657A7|nr:STAS domain-containing protein [Butyrivibrio sp. YAB3001]SFC86671.1 STAS domain-containing protein [Butyrivibrio sp. YAB3001]
MLNTQMSSEDGILTVTLEGRLDALTASDFSDELQDAIEDKTGLILDFEELEYISSAGLRTVLVAQQTLEDKGYDNVKVINANESIKEIFEDTGFSDIIDIE